MGHSGQSADSHAFVMAIYHACIEVISISTLVSKTGSDSYSSCAVVQNRKKPGSERSTLYLGVYWSQKAGPHFYGAEVVHVSQVQSAPWTV